MTGSTFEAFVARHSEPCKIQQIRIWGLCAEEGALCAASDPMAKSCAHVRVAEVNTDRAGHSNPVQNVVVAVSFLWKVGVNCGACRARAKRALGELSATIDACKESWGGTDDPLRMISHPMSKSNKQQRYGEDYRAAVAQRAVQEHLVGSVASFARAQPDLCEKTAERWNGKFLGWYQASVWSNFEGVECISLSMDGTRLGKLAQEVFMYAAYSLEKEKGAWLAPMASYVFGGPLGRTPN